MAKNPSTLRGLAKLRTTDVIATREYQLLTKGGRKTKVWARYSRPRPLPGHTPSVYCVYQIEGLPTRTKPVACPGLDGIQALYMAMYLSWVDLVTTDEYREGRLTFWGIPDLGLPGATFERYLTEVAEHRAGTPQAKPQRPRPGPRRRRSPSAR